MCLYQFRFRFITKSLFITKSKINLDLLLNLSNYFEKYHKNSSKNKEKWGKIFTKKYQHSQY